MSRIAPALERAGTERQAPVVTQTASQLLGLIETSLGQATRVERHRHHGIGRWRGNPRRQRIAKRRRHTPPPAVLHCVDRLPDRSLIEPRHVHTVEARDRPLGRVGAQPPQARRAEQPTRPTTGRATIREDEIEQPLIQR